MEYELTDAGLCRKKMLLKFSVSDVDAAFDASYKEINAYVKIKGFRKGKAPRRALENRYGKEIADTARQNLTRDKLSEAINKEGLEVMGNFQVSDNKKLPVFGQPFDLELEFNVVPKFDLPEYKGLEIKEQPVEVADEKIDESIERYRRMFAKYEAIEEPAKEADVLTVDFITKVDGEEIMSMNDQRLRVEGEILFGLPCPQLVEKFVGVKTGDLVELTVTLPQDHTNPDLRGRDAQVEVTVKGVERGAMPDIDDAFAQGLGMGDLAQFRERIKGNLVREAVIEARQKEESELIDNLLGESDFQLPKDVVDAETNALVDQQRMRLTRAGVKTGEVLDGQLEKYRPEAARLAEKQIRWGLMSQKIAKQEGIEVTNDDMGAQVEALAQSYNTTPAKIIQRIREFDGIEPMMAEILSIKVVQFILDHGKGRKLDPSRVGDTEAANADAVQSLAELTSEGEGCSCGHDHTHDHNH